MKLVVVITNIPMIIKLNLAEKTNSDLSSLIKEMDGPQWLLHLKTENLF